MYYYIVDGHVLLHGNVVVAVVVIKHETFSALGDNHIIIYNILLYLLYIVIVLVWRNARTRRTCIMLFYNVPYVVQLVQNLVNIRHRYEAGILSNYRIHQITGILIFHNTIVSLFREINTHTTLHLLLFVTYQVKK